MDNLALIIALTGAGCTVLGSCINYLGFQKKKTKDTKEDTKELATMGQEIRYVSKGVDDIKYDVRGINKIVTDMNERLIRVEESTKIAHHRIDKIEEGK